ncbi:MAG: hypothetical protein IT385_27760 [Deltaproteobacteria bacterium]|nr:hypothetical protein [Deltaproteobacteria bacterium]
MNEPARFALSDDLGAAWLARLPAGSVDALVIDPRAPRATRRLRAHGDAAAEQDAARALGALAWEVGRVLAPGRRAAWLCESRHGLGLARLCERYGLEVSPPVIWDRGEAARGGRLRWILALSKGRARGLPTLPDLVAAPVAATSGLPEPIADLLVMTGSFAGQWVLEPFAQEPALALAATRLGRSYWGASHLEDARRELARTLIGAGCRRLEDGPLSLRPRGLDIGVGPGGASQLSFEPVDVDEPRAAAPSVVIAEDGAPVEAADVRGPADPPDEVRTGAV